MMYCSAEVWSSKSVEQLLLKNDRFVPYKMSTRTVNNGWLANAGSKFPAASTILANS